ncbi:MAG: hypothetical protein CMF87_03520 [Candidatus Marinimicrobia bacterium]|nr:hypothetical protein [Candidatus Neomarinimicrobiota bacterium]|tara:strand:- start:405 stop:605 length:201 start_codon:yes stop_codon:yes gene_type:complete
MDLKDKLNFVWKFAFLAIFTYGVISLTCCSDSCTKSCDKSGSDKCSSAMVEGKCCKETAKPCGSKI